VVMISVVFRNISTKKWCLSFPVFSGDACTEFRYI